MARFSWNAFVGKHSKSDFSPFTGIPEILVAHTIYNIHLQSQAPVMLSTLCDSLIGVVERRDIVNAQLSLRDKDFIAEAEGKYTLTHNGKVYLHRIMKNKKAEIQSYIDEKGSGFSITQR